MFRCRFGDVSASNFAEEIVCIFTMLLGMIVIYGVLLGGMSSILTNNSSLQAAYTYRIAIMKKCLVSLISMLSFSAFLL